MAIKEIYLAEPIRSGDNADGDRFGSRSYFIWADTTDNEASLLRLVGEFAPILKLYAAHPNDQSRMIVARSLDMLGVSTWDGDNQAAIHWQLGIDYGVYRPAVGESNGSPLSYKPRISVISNRIARVATHDTDDKPILNTAGDPYDPAIEKDATSIALMVRRNEPVGDIATAMMNVFRRADKINKNAWNGFDARTLKVGPLSLPEREYDPIAKRYYYSVEYTFEFNPDGWDKPVVSAGFRYLDSSTDPAKLKQALIEGVPVPQAVLLDEDGGLIPPPAEDYYVQNHKIYEELDFTEFGMDTLLADQNAPPPTDGSGEFM